VLDSDPRRVNDAGALNAAVGLIGGADRGKAANRRISTMAKSRFARAAARCRDRPC
jgi:hypothetical protein